MSKLSVEICKRIYDVEVTPGEELFICSVAKYVEQELNEVQNAGIVDTQKMAILAALNIAAELFRLKDSREDNSSVVDKKADEMIRVLEQALSV
ncbi:MAG TPA: hypothetical protein DEE98_07780 [Elusimicrobia bacterium]|nr:MAG: hypothetical protein A2278_00615 [Elusimicrobia bacterium RIFOXYA12_FULL_49_49]OGS08831.1 MAG: hypothetical protein A2204_04170 [Elusimicrobia bacterium RIFOXYA1_FULL_47_7]OGS11003.1 MAG: hypothetical protein A2386_00290 [Elusimicrobia bacterium RIFOXYB1_FULL_48_9]OGS15160.1 MAG: hypothetical protein A2251_00625 [Elusimicrobia bacterium RIFOXYA2_FULL_47_53]OGS29780.1 MAG: hypothetical protein A2323_01425 [Elusimicrobia bacterium RIFOXYB2_FULL_46_23]HBU70262.1 hypothetical protein [Elus